MYDAVPAHSSWKLSRTFAPISATLRPGVNVPIETTADLMDAFRESATSSDDRNRPDMYQERYVDRRKRSPRG
jgi:hypothetical protein